MNTTRERSFRRNMSALDSVFDFISDSISEFNISPTVAYALQFAVEEVFTNLIKYDPQADPTIPIRMIKSDNRILVEIINNRGKDFDMTVETRTDSHPYRQENGGLGMYLVKRMVDEFRYEYTDGTGIITIIASMEEKSV